MSASISEYVKKSASVNDKSAIVAHYNLRNISHTDLQKMAQELVDVGAVKQSEKADFVLPYVNRCNLDGSPNPDWDAPMDYIELAEQALAIQSAGGCLGLRSLRQQEFRVFLLKRFEQRACD